MSVQNIENIIMLSLLNNLSNKKSESSSNFNLVLNSLMSSFAKESSYINTPIDSISFENNINTLDTLQGNINSQKIINTNNSNSSNQTNAAINLAYRQIDKPYVWGAAGPSSFDCSGFTSYIYKNAFNKNIPRTSIQQSNYGLQVDKKDLQPGDLVFFDTDKDGDVNHVGMYIGNNEFIHASSGKDKVVKSSLDNSFYNSVYKGARRP